MIVIITREHDAHALHVANLIREIVHEVFLLNYSAFPAEGEITYQIRSGVPTLTIEAEGRVIRSEDIQSVFYSRITDAVPSAAIKDSEIRNYVIRETNHFFESLPYMLNCFWMNQPDKQLVANRKPYQLLIASKVGFETPDSLVTNSPRQVAKFIASREFVAAKTLWTPGIAVIRDGQEEGVSLYTKRLSKEEVIERSESISNCPMIFQPYVEKLIELRITIVGKKVFACSIESQRSEKTQEDWRNYDIENTPHSEFELPNEVRSKCLALMQELGLYYGCIDMIVTPSNEFVFLEINPGGQWLWVEKLTKMPISEAIVEALASANN
jgi:glutathione synthase/RimK-type ligase-like ATP-grasp enzyme